MDSGIKEGAAEGLKKEPQQAKQRTLDVGGGERRWLVKQRKPHHRVRFTVAVVVPFEDRRLCEILHGLDCKANINKIGFTLLQSGFEMCFAPSTKGAGIL